jgi:virginiamycin B lyase
MFCWSSFATAQTATEFAIPTTASKPFGIATGPDGALWFVEGNGNKIGRITTAGAITEYPITTTAKFGGSSHPQCIVNHPADGALWFVEGDGNKIGRISTAGVITEFPNFAGGWPQCLTVGPDGALWIADQGPMGGGAASGDGWIGRITTAGVLTRFPLPNHNVQANFIAAGADGALWFGTDANTIDRITTAGVITEFTLPTPNSGVFGITAGPDGALWFAEPLANKIGRITTAGTITEIPLPTAGSGPTWIVTGPDGALWFTEAAPVPIGNGDLAFNGNRIGRITTSGAISEFTLPTAGSGPVVIAPGPDGALWITEATANKIAKLTLPPLPPTDIVGGWYMNGPAGSVAGTTSAKAFTFTGDGKYYLADDDSSVLDPTGRSGMEQGFYTWNPATGAFTDLTMTDTNGQWGLSHSICNNALISGNTLTMSCADTSNPTAFSSFSLTRVVNTTNPIVGSWYGGTATSNRMFTFLSDGTFLSAGNENPALDPTGQKGMERGTYTWNSSSGAFTHVTTVNTDGQWGFSQSICNKAIVSGDTLTLTCADTATPTAFSSFSATRVAAATSAGTTVPSATTPLPPPPTAQTAYTVPSGRMPTAAVSVDLRGSTYGNAILVVTLDLSKVLSGGSFAGQGQFAAGYNIYVVALVPSGVLGLPSATWFMLPATGAWAALGFPLAAYMEGLAQDATNSVVITILQGLDITSLPGTEIYIGYGTDDQEMLAAGRYRGVYVVR